MSRKEKPNVLGGIGALLAIAGLFGGMIVARWVAGQGTSAFLDAAGRLDVDSFYTGRNRDHLIGIGAYWSLALLYAAPVLVTAAVANPPSHQRGLFARAGTYTLLGFTALYTSGIVSFAFDPSRSSYREPLIRRYEEFSSEAADLVMAATWTMLVTGLAAFGASISGRRIVSSALPAVAFFASAAIFAATFD